MIYENIFSRVPLLLSLSGGVSGAESRQLLLFQRSSLLL